MLLEKITGPADIKKFSMDELKTLAAECRSALIHYLSKHGGHCGPNFGFVEATIALHYVFDSPKDKFVYDVAHQSYTHKMLTGRQKAYLCEENFGEVSGFTNPEESEHDFFNIGHTSTAVSLASGLAKARDFKGEKDNIVAILGDGSLSGGEAMEAIDWIGEQTTNFILVLNDNQMSIEENHGGVYKNLAALRESNGTCQNNFFKAMGLDYIYVADGNDLEQLVAAFKKVKDIDHPICVHLNTLKGKGFKPAEENKEAWHWHSPFDPATGELLYKGNGTENYGTITNQYLMKKMKEDPKVCAITAAVAANMGFFKPQRDEAGEQFLDVGIAEEHAVALASGLAKNGGKPVFSTHSSFIQRTYDQISQDLCINKNPATIMITTASIFGMNDITHLGLFDIPMMSNIPNLVYLAPTNVEEYLSMMEWSIEQNEYPVAIRQPCNGVHHAQGQVQTDWSDLNKFEIVQKGSKIAIVALGDFFQNGELAARLIEEKTGVKPTLINPRYITGLDTELLEALKMNHNLVITMEDGVAEGGFGQKIAAFYGTSDMKVMVRGFKKEFIDRYDAKEMLKENHLLPEQIAEDATAL
ncbi:MAG: 1-deoxy-D-xylulose-5-phosphate synthase [Treponema sp.]|nr:1-deoxy-D-xylulose-5-phosphate synthase [Candidatus Treponema equifaecale]